MPALSSASDRSRVQLCGQLSVEIGGTQLAPRLRGRQVPLLFAYLALNRRRHVGREELIGALWPGQPPRSQDAALRTLLSRLRSALGAEAVSGREEVRLALPEPLWIDFEAASLEVERALGSLEAGEHRNAWALAQVPLNIAGRGLLPGADARWLESPRRELEELRLRALEVIGRAGLSLGTRQLGSVQRAARALIDAEQYRESGWVLLMQALAAEGNLAEALRVFERLRALLRDELGTLPSPEALELHTQLLSPRAAGTEQEQEAEVTAIPLPPELRMHANGPMVGRRRELAELRAMWALGERSAEAPREGRRLVLLRGDPGVGKTRLVAEVAALAHADGAIVLAGRAPEDALAPYQPFAEALRQYVLGADTEELRRSTRGYGPELAPLAPELVRRLPEMGHRHRGEQISERYLMFEAFVGVLTEISRSAPLLLVLDDLHWADRPTLLLLRHVARAPALQRVLVLGAYRATETHSDAFADALAELRRDRWLGEFEVLGLDEREVGELVHAITGALPAEPLRQALYRQTEGNPFFVEEIVRHLRESGVALGRAGAGELQRAGLPPQVKDVIARRLGQLDESATETLRAAAVIGRDFDTALLERVVSLDEERFLGSLDAALAAGLIRDLPSPPGRCSFSHALIRETLYESMSASRRARLHRRVAAALEHGGEDDGRRLPALALHYTHAADPDDAEKAIEYAVRAGERATAMLAHEEAATHYASALGVLERFSPDERRRRLALLLALAEAETRAGERPAASETFRRAAGLATELGDRAALTQAAIGASDRYVQQPGVSDQELIALLERALAGCEGERSRTRVQLLARLCGALYYSSGRERAPALSEEALALADALGDAEAQAQAYAAVRRARWAPDRLPERLAAATKMLTCARRAGNLELELQAHAWLIVDLLEQGEIEPVGAQLEAFEAGAELIRQPLYLWTATVWRAMLAQLSGRLAEAEELATAALSAGVRAEPVTAPQYYAIQVFTIRAEQRRLGELRDAAREVVAASESVPAWRAMYARLLSEVGAVDEARAELAVLGSDDFAAIPRDGNWLSAICLLAHAAAGLGERDSCAVLYGLLEPFAEQIMVIGLAVACFGSVHRELGVLAATLGRPERAVDHLERAIEVNQRLRAPGWVAHCRLDLAALLGRRDERAADLVRAAAATAAELELPAVAARAEALG